MRQKEMVSVMIGLLFVLLYLYGVGIIISWAIGGIFGINIKWYFGTTLYVFFGNITDLTKS